MVLTTKLNLETYKTRRVNGGLGSVENSRFMTRSEQDLYSLVGWNLLCTEK